MTSGFDDPDAFRIDRDPNPHLGFGIGTHYRLGANLARAEIKVAFTELVARATSGWPTTPSCRGATRRWCSHLSTSAPSSRPE